MTRKILTTTDTMKAESYFCFHSHTMTDYLHLRSPGVARQRISQYPVKKLTRFFSLLYGMLVLRIT